MTEGNEQAAAAKPTTVDAFERLKWETEVAFRERELKIKEHESRPAIWKNALFMSVAAAVVGVIAHTAGTISDNMAQRTVETERLQASLIQKALELDDPMRVLTKLRLLYNSGLITVYHDNVRRLMESDDNAQYFTPPTDTGRQYQAALIEKAVENDDLGRVLKKLQMLDDADLIPDFSKTSKLRDMLRASREPAPVVVAALPDKPGMGAPSPVPVAPPPPVAPSVVPPPIAPTSVPPTAPPGDTTRAAAPNPCAAAAVNPAASRRMDLPRLDGNEPGPLGGFPQRDEIPELRWRAAQPGQERRSRQAQRSMPAHLVGQIPARRGRARPEGAGGGQAHPAPRDASADRRGGFSGRRRPHQQPVPGDLGQGGGSCGVGIHPVMISRGMMTA